MNPLQQLLGRYYYNFYVAAFETAALLVYLAVLTRRSRRHPLFPLRLALAAAVQLALCVPLSVLRTDRDGLPMRVGFECAILLAFFCAVLFLYREDQSELLLIFSSVVVCKNLSGTVIPLLRNLFGRSDLDSISFFADFVPARDWTIYYAVQLAFLLGIAALFSRGERERDVRVDLPGAALLALCVLAIRGVVHPVTRFYQPTSFPLSVCVKVLMLILYVTIIAIRAGLLSRTRMRTELMMTEELLLQEQKRYTQMRDSIEVINMKCHDLRRQLSALQGRLTDQELAALEEAVRLYDSSIRTGSKIVDTVLYQKRLACEKHAIRLRWMAEGRLVAFVEPSKLYALLSNALDNALEAVMELEPEKRIVTLNIFAEGGSAVVETTNYFDPARPAVAGTSKADKLHHGYGLKSMRYIAEEYEGTLRTAEEDGIFILTIRLPRGGRG